LTLTTGKFHAGGPLAPKSLRRLLANVLYTGVIHPQRKTYPGEHPAILTRGTWERARPLVAERAAIPHGRSRNKHLALLNGLLYCDSCSTRMVYSYASKNGRKYHCYLGLNAQLKGSAACPAKSPPAQAIEKSALDRIREQQHGIFELAVWEPLDRLRQVEAIRAVVERVGYDSHARQISIRLHAMAQAKISKCIKALATARRNRPAYVGRNKLN
jgi:hypothetical protein